MRRGDPGGARRWPWLPTAHNATYGADAWEDPDSEVRQAAKTKFVGQAKSVRGAAMPEFTRYPTLGVEKMWPVHHEDIEPLWTSVDGNTIYAQDQGGYFLKSTNSGETWTNRRLIPPLPGGTQRRLGDKGAFLRLENGTMLSFPRREPGVTGTYIARTADEGTSWTYVDVTTLVAGGYPLGPTSWCEDPNTGYVYFGEYVFSDTEAVVNLYRSTDSGASWHVFHAFPGPTSGHPDKVRHIHAVEWDHISERIVIMTGDGEPATGIYQVNAAGDGVEPLLLNRQVTNAYLHDNPNTPFMQAARAIGYIPFPDYICYAADSSLAAVVRVPRSALVTDGVTPVDVEVVQYINNGGWFVTRASDDGSRWILSSAQENPLRQLDRGSHIYAIEDQGATVFELGAHLAKETNAFVSLSPVGSGRHSGDTFYLRTHNADFPAFWKCSLMWSTGTSLPMPENIFKAAWAWQTFSVPQTTLEPGESLVFGSLRTPPGNPILAVYDMGIKRIPGNNGLRMKVINGDGTGDYSAFYANPSLRNDVGMAPSGRRVGQYNPPSGTDIQFVMVNTSTTAQGTGLAFITVGWSSTNGLIRPQ